MKPALQRLCSIVGLLAMVGSIILLFRENSLLGEGPFPIAVQVLAVGLMIWARVTFGRRSFHATADPTEGGLITSGPYSHIRHPIYASVLYIIWAGVLSHLSAASLALGVCAAVGAGIRIALEERLLAGRYPEYREYANRTKRVIPFLV